MISPAKRFLLVLVAFFGVLFLFHAASAQAQITCPHTVPDPPTDEDVLKEFYCATGGADWTNNSGWGTTSFNAGNWHGTWVSNGRVTYLGLSNNNLTGQIPANLNTLTSLTQLALHSNELTGRIPDLSALTGLTLLNLRNNQLTGRIPDLSALTSLERLHLNQNQLTGGVPDLSALTSLQILALNTNKLSGGIPTNLPTSLTQLWLHSNELSGGVPDLSALTGLTELHLHRNRLTGRIPELNTLTSLERLNLADNQLTGGIPDLSALTSLTQLALQNNVLSGQIPANLNTLTSLAYLRLNNNQLSGEIPDLSALTSLWYLRLNNNRLTGEMPDLSALTKLRLLRLDNNRLTGEIPTTVLGGLAELEDLGLWRNEGLTWDGDISDKLRLRIERAALQAFYNETRYDHPGNNRWISREGWSDRAQKFSFGSWFGVDTNTDGWVQRIELSGNGLYGEFPNSLEVLASLERLNLSHNRDLTGTLPLGLMDLPVNSLNIRCTGVRVPQSSGFNAWLNGITFRRGCPSELGLRLSASPNPVPWDGTGTITVEVPPAFEDVSVEIISTRGLCVWDDTFGNAVRVDIPGGRRSEKEVGFSVARNEGYYNGESCPEENKEDCKKCFFLWSASWTTGGERMTNSGNIIVLPILPPSGASAPPGTGGGGGPGPGGGGGGGPSTPTGDNEPSPGSDGETPREDEEPSTSCRQEDREILGSFYEMTNGEGWDRHENWNSDEPLGEWHGVETDKDENVVSLRLPDNGLSGKMPTRELLCLEDKELVELALWDNDDLSGEVPDELVLAVERAALREIAEMLNINPGWFENYDGDPYDFEDWYEGVTTDDDGRVTELDLPGEVPETIISQFRKLRMITTSSGGGGCAVGASSAQMKASDLLAVILILLAVSRGLRTRSD